MEQDAEEEYDIVDIDEDDEVVGGEDERPGTISLDDSQLLDDLNDSQDFSSTVDERENNPSFEMDDAELQWWLSLPDDATISQVQSPTATDLNHTPTTQRKNSITSKQSKKKPRKVLPCPSFKKIIGTNFIVDGFRYKSEEFKHYFLSHFHSDHYVGITKGFDFGTIYCSPITARLVQHVLKVDPKYIKALELNVWHHIEDAQVILMDANHCPGAVIFLFNIKGTYYLHTGDFRYDTKMKYYPPLRDISIEAVYLDNTFCDPNYKFPKQSVTIKSIVDIVRKEINSPTLFMVGTYTIGKEKIVLALAKEFNLKIYVDQSKYELMSRIEVDMSLFTTNPLESRLHVVPMGYVSFRKMSELLSSYRAKYKYIIGFQPTGWSMGKTINKVTRRKAGPLVIYGVPYSEHSSYEELRNFIAWLKPNQIIPTVDCDTPAKVQAILSHFKNVKEPHEDKSKILPYLLKNTWGKIKQTVSDGLMVCVEHFSTQTKSNDTISTETTSTLRVRKQTVVNESPQVIEIVDDETEEQSNHVKKELLINKSEDKQNQHVNYADDLPDLEDPDFIDFEAPDPKLIGQQKYLLHKVKSEQSPSNNKRSHSASQVLKGGVKTAGLKRSTSASKVTTPKTPRNTTSNKKLKPSPEHECSPGLKQQSVTAFFSPSAKKHEGVTNSW